MDAFQPTPPGQEALTQSEVERLLGQLSGPDAGAATAVAADPKASRKMEATEPYDFRNLVSVPANELRKLRAKHEEYAAALATRLSMYLRLEVSLQLSGLQTMPYRKFTASLNNPLHLVLFKVEPLRGVCLLNLSPRLGLTIVDRLMGGPGRPVDGAGELSDIEVALLEQAVHIITGEWCHHWPESTDLRAVLLGHETDSRFLQTSSPDAIMFTLTMEASVGECREPVQIAFPYAMIEPLVQKLGPRVNAERETGSTAPDTRPLWRIEYEDVVVQVAASWPAMELTARDLARLRVGDVLQVEPEVAANVQVSLAGTPKFTGRLGSQGGKLAVEITQVRKPA